VHPSESAPKTQRYVRSPGALVREGAFGVVVLGTETSDAVTLSGTAAALWDVLADPQTSTAVVDVLAEQFGLAPERVRPDVDSALEQLVQLGALERRA